MTPLIVHLAVLSLTIAALFCLGTQVSLRTLRRTAIDWRTLLVIGVGQWLLLPLIVHVFLITHGGTLEQELAVAVVALSPAGLIACTALYLVGISISAALVGVLLLETFGALVLFLLLTLVMPEAAEVARLEHALWKMSRAQFLLLVLPLMAGLALRHALPSAGDYFARPTRGLIWAAYGAVALFAVSLKAHFSYRVDTMAALPAVLGMIVCGALAGFAVYLIATHLLRLRGHDALMASLVIGVQGPAPALVLTVLHRDSWMDMAAIAIAYALLLPAMAAFWLLMSRTRWGVSLLPR